MSLWLRIELYMKIVRERDDTWCCSQRVWGEVKGDNDVLLLHPVISNFSWIGIWWTGQTRHTRLACNSEWDVTCMLTGSTTRKPILTVCNNSALFWVLFLLKGKVPVCHSFLIMYVRAGGVSFCRFLWRRITVWKHILCRVVVLTNVYFSTCFWILTCEGDFFFACLCFLAG